MISNTTSLSELVFKKKGNCNVMKLHDQSWNRFNLIETILYHNLSQSKPLINNLSPNLPNLTFRINFSNQSFKSTYAINLLIESTALLAYGTLLSQTNITHSSRREVYHLQAPLGSNVDKSLARHS